MRDKSINSVGEVEVANFLHMDAHANSHKGTCIESTFVKVQDMFR